MNIALVGSRIPNGVYITGSHFEAQKSSVSIRNTELLRAAFLWVITQPVVVIPYRRFGTTYQFQGP